MQNNIALFDQYVAQIFGRLYEHFPIPIALDACQLTGHHDVDEYARPIDAQGSLSQPFQVCKATIDWLIESGHLRVKDGNTYGYTDCVLTAKGLEVLKSVPDSVQVKTALGEKLVAALQRGATEIATELGKTAVRLGAGIVG